MKFAVTLIAVLLAVQANASPLPTVDAAVDGVIDKAVPSGDAPCDKETVVAPPVDQAPAPKADAPCEKTPEKSDKHGGPLAVVGGVVNTVEHVVGGVGKGAAGLLTGGLGVGIGLGEKGLGVGAALGHGLGLGSSDGTGIALG